MPSLLHLCVLSPDLSGTDLASQNRSDHSGRERARNHSVGEMAGVFTSPVAKKISNRATFGVSRSWQVLSRAHLQTGSRDPVATQVST